ncbi:MAG: hypothetical protein ABII96_08915 [Candidatus Zixiibacteriota bacterium]
MLDNIFHFMIFELPIPSYDTERFDFTHHPEFVEGGGRRELESLPIDDLN